MEREIKYINKKAVAILRVSSARQEDNFSHAVQLKYAKEYCERDTNNQKLDLVRVFTLVESAKDPEERKQYNEAMTFISKNKIGNVIFYMPDREARNSTDLETNARKVKRGEFILHYAHDRKCFHKGTPSGERLSRAIHGALNGNYSDVLAERIFDGTTEKAEQGWYPGSHPPLGYINKHDTDPVTGQTKKRGCTIAVDPNENNVRIVLREYELRAQGLSLEDIRQKIKEEGLLTEKQKLTYRTSTISERLRNPFYRGQFQWYEKMYPGKHELFIPKKLRDAVDRAMNLKASAIVREESEHTILMGGWLKCSCGCNIVYDPKVKILKTTGEERTYHYCHCTNGTQAHETQKGLITTTDKVWALQQNRGN